MRSILLALLTSAIVSCLVQGVAAQEQLQKFDEASLREAGSLSPAQQTEIAQLRFVILNDVEKTPDDEWAGSYVFEDGPTSGAQFDWTPSHGFVVWWMTCSNGMRDKINFGGVTVQDGALYLEPKLQTQSGKVYAVSPEFIKVKWGERHYLIPADKMIAFCYAALNAARSLEINEFFLKKSDRTKKSYGLPEVPEAYRKYLNGNPIRARIIELKSQTAGFILNKGRNAGVVPGMKLFATSPRSVFALAEVVAVTDETSEVFVITSGFKRGGRKNGNPQVGWEFTSRAPKGARDYFPG